MTLHIQGRHFTLVGTESRRLPCLLNIYVRVKAIPDRGQSLLHSTLILSRTISRLVQGLVLLMLSVWLVIIMQGQGTGIMPCDNSVECAQSAVCCYTHVAPLCQRHLASSMHYQQLHIFTCSITESESDISTVAILPIFKKEKNFKLVT